MLKPDENKIKKFNESEIGKAKNFYFKRAIITGIISITIGLGWIILNIYMKLNWFEYILPTILTLFGIFFIFSSNRLKYQEINRFNYENKVSKK